MSVKLRMLLKSARVDPGLVEITPFAGRPVRRPEQEMVRERDIATGRERDIDPASGEVFHEYPRGVLSIELCFISDGEQPTSFDDVREWVEAYVKGSMARLDITIEEA